MIRLFFLSSLSIFLTSCAFTPQAVRINPNVDVRQSQIGNGRDLSINVVDERPKKTLGTVGASNVGADISIEGDLVASIQDALVDGLSRMYFKPNPARLPGNTELRIEIRNLDYTIITGFWMGTLRVDTGLKAICIRNGIRPYEKLYHGEFTESIGVVQSQEANTIYINKAVSSAVNALLADQELLSSLAQ